MQFQYTERFIRTFWLRVWKGDYVSPFSPDGLPCWVWCGARNKRSGHGKVKTNDRCTSTHRVSWELANGPIPKGKWVRHLCHVRTCVNPSHLKLGTAKENSQDRVDAGRASGPNGAASPQISLEPIVPRWSKFRSTEIKFWEGVSDTPDANGCWRWIGSYRGETGYGYITDNGKMLSAHRASWELHYGPIPEGLLVRHKCPGGGNRWCVNPEHLKVGTHQENAEDTVSDGRHRGKWTPEQREAFRKVRRDYTAAHPETIARGDDHYLRKDPGRAPRGEKCNNARYSDATIFEALDWMAQGASDTDVVRHFGISYSHTGRLRRGTGHVLTW